MYKKKKTYELEVHFGLLVLVVIMLSLNIVSNYVIHNTKNMLYDNSVTEMYNVSLPLSRYIQNNQLTTIASSTKEQFLYQYKLNEIILLNTTQKDFTKKAKLEILKNIMHKNSNEKLMELSNIILPAEYYSLSRGRENQYYYTVPIQNRKTNQILIISKKIHKLAYLDDASDWLVIISLVALLAVLIIYILLYRFILSPFKSLKEKAKSAGRTILPSNYEVDSVIDEYQMIIKELKEKETELIEMHEQETLRADSFEQFNDYLLGSMQAGVITIDTNGKIMTINSAAEKMCQVISELYVHDDFRKLPFLNTNLRSKIDDTLLRKLSHPYKEYEFSEPALRVGITISPVCDNETHQIGASLLINDISEIKKLQSELEKNRQMSALGEMSAGLAHQLRNSLGAIVGYNQLVKKRLNQKELDTSIVDSMARELQESESLIKRFLNFTKPFDYAPEDEFIARSVKNIIETLSVRNDFDDITFNLKNNLPEDAVFSIDQLLLKQALTNIIENSKNAYNGQANCIDIVLEKNRNSDCVIAITDYAGGIEKENIEKIFTPFYSTNPSSSGLGLPLAQKVIALHNGLLQVDSTVGQGTTFTIILPANHKSNLEKSDKLIINS